MDLFHVFVRLFGDYINFVFELGGAILTWANVHRLWKDKGYAGINAPCVAFFFLWGVWNLAYYPSLGQWMSFYAGCVLVTANAAWFVMACWYGPLRQPDAAP